ncbi:MAG: hypothetical protein MK137_07365 [Rickettsiales bacterium]|nr:hypothetical protein [Rickettsiales bacterium]
MRKSASYKEFGNIDEDERNERIDRLQRQASSMPIDDQIDQAFSIWSKTLLPINDDMRHDQNAVEMVEKGNDVLKRIFIATHVAGVSVLNGEEGTTELPPASHYSHGNRVIYDFQADTEPEKAEMKDKLLNWISSGSTEAEHISKKMDHNSAFENDSLVLHQRPLATHTMVETEQGLEERKGHIAAIKSRVKGDRHLGMPLTIGGYGEQDIHGGVVMPDGQHGYLYINDGQSPVSLMIGVENSAYGSMGVHAKVKHGVRGYTNPVSAAQLPKMRELARHNSENHDGDYKVPDMGQARIIIDQQMLEDIVSHSADDFQLMMLRGYRKSSSAGKPTEVGTNAIDPVPERVKGNNVGDEALRVARSVASVIDQPGDANVITKDKNIENKSRSSNEQNSERSL